MSGPGDVPVEPRRRWAWIVLAALVPGALLFWGNACFIWNHFLEGPYLQDSGWYSAIVYRNDFFPKSPPVADWRTEYYGIHASLLVSFASMLSYAFPGDRVAWYCLFQGAIYAPLGALVALLVGPRAGRGKGEGLRDALMVGGCGLAFALNGQVIACMGYPHYEIFGAVGICLMLAGLGSGRSRLAWVGLVAAVCAREDGGLHAVSFLAAVLACELLKRPLPVKRRQVLTMAGAALASSVILIVAQKAFFQHANYLAALREGGRAVDGLDLFRHEYLGVPAFAHIDAASLAARARRLTGETAFILLPLLATALIAIATRDARYLLGWAVELPWFVVNFLAYQELKSSFQIYTGFPFIASIFWVGVYAHVRGDGRRRTLGLLAAVALTSTFGSWYSTPASFVFLFERAAVPVAIPSAGIRSFSRKIRENPDAYGPIFVDHGVAAWTLERLAIEARIHPNAMIRDDQPVTTAMLAERDGMAFFKDGLLSPILVRLLADSPFSRCGRIAGTGLFFCTREERALPPEFTPSSVLMARLRTQGTARREGESIVIAAAPATGIMAFGATAQLRPGAYSVIWSTRTLECPFATDAPRMRFDVADAGREIVSRNVVRADERVALDLDVSDPQQLLELRAWSGSCTYVIEELTIRSR